MLHHHTKFGYRRFSSWGDNPDEHSLEFWTSSVTLTLTTTEQSNHFTRRLMMMYYQNKFSCQIISNSDNVLKSHILIILSLTVTLTLETANQTFWKTIWLIIMHHHTNLVVKGLAIQKISSGQTFIKFGCQGINSSENIVERVIFWSYEPSLWPWPWNSNNYKKFAMTLWLMMLHNPTGFGHKIFGNSEYILRANIH